MTNTNHSSDTAKQNRKRRRRRAPKAGYSGNAAGNAARNASRATANTAVSGGRYGALSAEQMVQIHSAVLDILNSVGFSEMPEHAVETIISAGGKLSANNRVCMPPTLVEKALAGFQRNITLYGRQPEYALELHGNRVFMGTGGAAPLVVDLHTGAYRDSTLNDLYAAARLADALENIHFFSRSVVARDMPNEYALDVNTAYASLSGTSKHVMTSAASVDSVKAIARMCWTIAGSKQAFLDQPFLSLNVNHAVSPMRVSESAIDVLVCAAELGIPVHANTFAQLGASSPVTIAGCVAQTMAETLGGMVLAWLINPAAKIICGPRPMVTDLRTGAMSGGSGEQALLTAAVVQMAQYYGLSNSTIAGATDSKLGDAQSGYEKCLSITLAAQTGANLITQACGVQASLMACSFESFVIDNDMLGSILRSLSPIEVSDETLNTQQIQQAVQGEGHFLGHQQTFDRMQTDFLYPKIANRDNHEVWEANGSLDIRRVANQKAQALLKEPVRINIDDNTDKHLRAEFEIYLP